MLAAAASLPGAEAPVDLRFFLSGVIAAWLTVEQIQFIDIGKILRPSCRAFHLQCRALLKVAINKWWRVWAAQDIWNLSQPIVSVLQVLASAAAPASWCRWAGWCEHVAPSVDGG